MALPRRAPRSLGLAAIVAVALGPGACSKQASPPPESGQAAFGNQSAAAVPFMPEGQASAPSPQSPVLPFQPPPDPNDPAARFVPIQSQAVKDAIYRALKTGKTQRWQDGELSGYAVPSAATGANGCRAVRYTVDQRPDVPFESINACDATPHH